LVTNSILTLLETRQRTWLIIDELPSLQKLTCLKDLLAQSRKFGGCCVLSVQNIAQLQEVYGIPGTKAIVDLCKSRVFFRAPSQETAKWVSQELGDGEWLEVQHGISYGANTMRDGVSLQHHRVQKPAVPASTIKKLPNLHAIVSIPPAMAHQSVPKRWPVAKVELTWQQRSVIAPAFVLRKSAEPITQDKHKDVSDVWNVVKSDKKTKKAIKSTKQKKKFS
jgi:type IV secretory pathway TraG/TraD family ATPase VirD4